MNITIVKRQGVKPPTEFVLNKCMNYFNANFGYALARNGIILINKLFTKKEDFLISWNQSKITEDDAVLIFFSDQINESDPIPHTNKIDLMKKELVQCKCKVFAHGGNFESCEQIKNFDNLIANIADFDCNKFHKITEMCYHNSKIAILHPNKNIELYGEWKQSNGMLFSNNYYTKSSKKINKLAKKKNINSKQTFAMTFTSFSKELNKIFDI